MATEPATAGGDLYTKSDAHVHEHDVKRERSVHVRKYAAKQQISEDQALQVGLRDEASEFVKKGSEMYGSAAR